MPIMNAGKIKMDDSGCGIKTFKGHNIQTSTGKAVFPLDMRIEDIDIHDIAASLSRICRYNGHLKSEIEHYSVAQHSVHVSRICEKHFDMSIPYLRQALLHDAAESYVGDMVRPLKFSLPQYCDIKANVWKIICERFNLPFELHPSVKKADNIALATEKRDLLVSNGKADWGTLPPPDTKIIKPYRARLARELFLDRADQLQIIT